ncbi:hypothetical protein Htur_4957 (plasmid) [Haloterrigena turkmenica DSM 5511]|uniref:Uncharacterized protein n=1 Tax=Haloterrigena turkmenica (strain ATCC 51198 / DSM 5511 / JCM 9101 / NCIMB 13204 / VKM B-1734 / 4k) TaxID=543526 RepID=D2S2U6_HALTV|nr:hypothetical protein Htur_4957 [Haloterrigena turkmenica DSM 5511]
MDDQHILGYLLWRAWSNFRSIDEDQLSEEDRERNADAVALLEDVSLLESGGRSESSGSSTAGRLASQAIASARPISF